MHKAMNEIWWSSSDVWCMYAWSRPNDLQKSRWWWLNNILPFRGSLFSRLNSTMVFLILFARYAADSNAMPCNDDLSLFQNLQSEASFLYVDEWIDLVLKWQSYQKCNIKHQLKSRFTFHLLHIFWYLWLLTVRRKAISGVWESPWGALSIGRIISLIGRLLSVKKGWESRRQL